MLHFDQKLQLLNKTTRARSARQILREKRGVFGVVRGVVVVACGPCDSETVAQDKFSSKCYKVCLKERNPEIELISIGSCL